MKRNYGIDLAKWLAMFMIVVIHNLLNGGVLSVKSTNINNLSYWFLENIAIVGVNMFALASGYLLINKKIKVQHVIDLWKNVIFWSVVPTLIIMEWTRNWNLINIAKAFFPFFTGRYWYFNAYVGLCLLIPFINEGYKKLTQQSCERIVILLLLFSVTVGMLNKFFLMGGYSTQWLLIMYLTGAYIHTTTRNLSKISNLLLIGIFLLMALVSLLGEYVSIKHVGHLYIWFNYNSPMVVVQSIALFLVFERMNVKSTRIKTFLKKFTPLTFSVYLIDANPEFFNIVLRSAFRFVQEKNLFEGYMIIFGVSVSLFCSFIISAYVKTQLENVLVRRR